MTDWSLEGDSLYQKVKRYLCRKIFEGSYQDGDRIPSERQLSKELGVSRVTVRKALKLLEEERIIKRTQGSGTHVALHYEARQGNLGIITLVAQAQNDFFTQFVDAFQTKADELDSLVLYKQKPRRFSLEDCLFQIYEKELRNVVLWLENMELEERTLQKLCGLGMKIVLFDIVDGGQYADAVCLDNADAVERIYRALREKGCQRMGYVNWDEEKNGSLRVREETFRKLDHTGEIVRIPYCYHNRLQDLPEELILETLDSLRNCDGILYAVGELGILFESYAREKGILHEAGMVGRMPGAEEMGIYMVEQDFSGMAEQIFECLSKQNCADSGWKAGSYRVKGLE